MVCENNKMLNFARRENHLYILLRIYAISCFSDFKFFLKKITEI